VLKTSLCFQGNTVWWQVCWGNTVWWQACWGKTVRIYSLSVRDVRTSAINLNEESWNRRSHPEGSKNGSRNPPRLSQPHLL
jgi:hypothetical protein